MAPSYHVCACFTRSASVIRTVRGTSARSARIRNGLAEPSPHIVHIYITRLELATPDKPGFGTGIGKKPRPLDWEVRRCAEVVSGIASHKRGATGHTLKKPNAPVNP